MQTTRFKPWSPLRAATNVALVVLLAHAAWPTARADDDPKAAAREHFRKGVAAFEDKRFAAAADEFTAAYGLSPAYVVLYNIGQVDVALGRSVEAVAAFKQYLKDGGSSVSPQRRLEVEKEVQDQLARIGTVVVRTEPPGAEVRIDGHRVGETPLSEPIQVTAGKHTVEGLLAGHPAAIQEVEVHGEVGIEVMLVLLEATAASPSPPAPDPPPLPADHPPSVGAPAPAASGGSQGTTDSGADTARPANRRRAVAYVLIGAGLAAAGVGGVLAIEGAREGNDASDKYRQDPSQKSRYDEGKRENRTGFITAAAGGAALLAGIVLLAIPSRGDRSTVGLAPWIGVPAGAAIVGRF
jgi:hypothetical protein